MDTRRTLLTLAMLPLMFVPVGCAGSADDDVESPQMSQRDAQDPVEAMRVEMSVPAEHATAEEMTALVEHLEGHADVAQAKAAVHKSSETGAAEVSVELWGHDMPTDQELIAAVQEEFPYIAQIAVSPIDVEAEAMPQDMEAEDPDVLRQQIIDDLRAKGVEGEIEVNITDHPDGRREVDVQVLDDEPPPA